MQPSTNATMRLDLLVPTLRRPALLRRTLDSVARADRPEALRVRVIVINNDRAPELPGVDDVLAALPWPVTVVHEPEPGKSRALNAGFAASDGDYVGFVDDDEELDRQWFAVAERALRDGRLDYIGGRSVAQWLEKPPVWLPADYPAVLGIAEGGAVARPYGPGFPGMLTGGNAVISRAALQRIGPFCSALGPRVDRRLFSCEDEDLYWRLVDSGARGMYLPDLIVYHAIHPERLRKRYYRSWSFWNGASKGVLSRRRPHQTPRIAGVPRYLFGDAVRGAFRLAFMLVAGGAPSRRFSAELPLWHLAGQLYGRHFPGTASGDRSVAAASKGRATELAPTR